MRSIKNNKAAIVTTVVVVILILAGTAVVIGLIQPLLMGGEEVIATQVCHSMLIKRAAIDFREFDFTAEGLGNIQYGLGVVGVFKAAWDYGLTGATNSLSDSAEEYTKDQLRKSCRQIEVDCKGPADEVALCLYDKMSTTFYTLLGGFPSDAPYTDFDLYKINVDVAGDGVIDLKGSCENYAGVVELKMAEDGLGTDQLYYDFQSETVVKESEYQYEKWDFSIRTPDEPNDDVQLGGFSVTPPVPLYIVGGQSSTTTCSEDITIAEYEAGGDNAYLSADEWACIRFDIDDDGDDGNDVYVKMHYLQNTGGLEDGKVKRPAEFYWDWERKTEGADNYRKYDCSNPDEDLEDLNICYKERTDKDTNEKTCRIKFTHIDYFTMGLSMIEECQLKGISSSACKCFALPEHGYNPSNGLPLGTKFRLEFDGTEADDLELPGFKLPEYEDASGSSEEYYDSDINRTFKNYSYYPRYSNDPENNAYDYQGCGWIPEPAVFSGIGIYGRTYVDGIEVVPIGSNIVTLREGEIWPPSRMYLENLNLKTGDKTVLYSRITKNSFRVYGYRDVIAGRFWDHYDLINKITTVRVYEKEQ